MRAEPRRTDAGAGRNPRPEYFRRIRPDAKRRTAHVGPAAGYGESKCRDSGIVGSPDGQSGVLAYHRPDSIGPDRLADRTTNERTPFGFLFRRQPDIRGIAELSKQNITGNTFSGTYYVPENLQGINAAIKRPERQNPSNAPVGATYLYVQGTTYGRQVAYYIYLGGNNIDDFNIQRNHQYVVQANISGINTIDTRVSTVDLTFGAIKNPCNVGETVTSSVTLKCTNSPARQIYLSAMLAEGGGTLTVNGSAWTPGRGHAFLQKETKPARFRLRWSQIAPD